MSEQSSNTRLKDEIRKKIESASLSDEQIAALNARLNPIVKPKIAWSISTIVAGLLLTLGLGLMLHTQWKNWQKEQLIASLVQEIVDDHMLQQPLDFLSSDLADLDQQFCDLDFTLVNTIQLPDLNTVLVGGRYSPIQGKIAAQLRLQVLDAEPSSLYQMTFETENFSKLGNINVDEQPLLSYAKGFSITLWEEKGVLMALVESVHTATEQQPVAVMPELVAPSQ